MRTMNQAERRCILALPRRRLIILLPFAHKPGIIYLCTPVSISRADLYCLGM